MNATMRWGVCAVVWVLCSSRAVGQEYGNAGAHLAGWRTVTVTRPNSTTFSARLYYPATSAGQNTGFDGSGGPYPAVSFGHGFLQPVDRYQSTLLHLATWGIIVIASESEGGLFPSHSNFALDLRHCLTYLEQQNTTSGALLYQGVATGKFGMSGHSMGGGASILATAADTRVKALANLAAAETNPSATAQMAGVSVPVSLISGSADTIVPVGNNGQLMFNAGRAPKLLPVIQGGWHCGFEDVSTIGCDSGPMTRADQLFLTRRLLASFFRLYLGDDQLAWDVVWGPGRSADTRVVTTGVSGISLAPSAVTVSAFQNGTMTGAFTVMNTGPAARSFAVVVEGAGWPAVADPMQTGLLNPGQGVAVGVTVTAPPGWATLAEDMLVTARSVEDGGTRGWAQLTARRKCIADQDGSGVLTANDFQAYMNAYAGGSESADVDGTGSLTANDFQAFMNAFASGCAR